VVSKNRNGPQWSQDPLKDCRLDLSNSRSQNHPKTSQTFSTFQIQPQGVANPSALMGEVDAFLAGIAHEVDKAIKMRGQQINKFGNNLTRNEPST
jgi:hypothetical protein